MKNSELLHHANDRTIGGLDKQRRFLIREYIIRKSCPNCGTPVNVFEATGIDLDDYDFDGSKMEPGKCPKCKRGLKFMLPFMGGWHWSLVPIEVPVEIEV